jgi:succinyldiaminopimelate transaminase
MARTLLSSSLPDFPWDSLDDARAKASAHPGGMVNLSVGTPVDPVDPLIREALAGASAEPGYPQASGTPQLREAAAASLARRYGVEGLAPSAVVPAIGTKELIAWLPTLLGLGKGDIVVIPELAYPTYEVGAKLAGCQVVRADSPLDGVKPGLIWINSPSNPTGAVMGVSEMAAMAAWARQTGAVLASDECYLGLPWEAEPFSVLHPQVCGGSFDNLLAVHSLSKTANLASYRAGFVAGDQELATELLAVRKHAGMLMPYAIQAAMTASLGDDEHERRQRERYGKRREVLLRAARDAGFTVEGSEAGLYLWATRDEHGRATIEWLADRGILAAPGDFYGPTGVNYVRMALTETDERIAEAAKRLVE